MPSSRARYSAISAWVEMKRFSTSSTILRWRYSLLGIIIQSYRSSYIRGSVSQVGGHGVFRNGFRTWWWRGDCTPEFLDAGQVIAPANGLAQFQFLHGHGHGILC